MTLQARLTLWSMLVMASIVTIVTISDLIGEINGQFGNALERAQLISNIAANSIKREVGPGSDADLAKSILNRPNLQEELLDLALEAKIVDEIAVTDSRGIVVADSFPTSIGTRYPQNVPKLESLLKTQFVWEKLKVLSRGRPGYELATMWNQHGTARAGEPITIHVIVLPKLMQGSVTPILTHHAWVAILSVVGAVLAAFLFSTIAFQPLGKLGKMLDMVATGEYELQQISQPSSDEFAAVAFKVSMLGQKLHG